MMTKIILTFCSLMVLLLPYSSAQEIYYKMKNGKILNAEQYRDAKASAALRGEVQEMVIKTETRSDSILKSVRITILMRDDEGNVLDPYKEHRSLIGKKFPIEKFKNADGTFYSFSQLKGEPTLINFWFTNCIPCVAEIPILNELENKYGEKVNFLAITFEDLQTVNKFLEKKPFNFKHIVDAKEQIDSLQYTAFPANLLLDGDGKVMYVLGELSQSYDDIEIILDGLITKH